MGFASIFCLVLDGDGWRKHVREDAPEVGRSGRSERREWIRERFQEVGRPKQVAGNAGDPEVVSKTLVDDVFESSVIEDGDRATIDINDSLAFPRSELFVDRLAGRTDHAGEKVLR